MEIIIQQITLNPAKKITEKAYSGGISDIDALAAENIAPLAQYNIDKVLEITEKITELCREPLCFEVILQRLFADYGLTMNFEQYALVGSTVCYHLA